MQAFRVAASGRGPWSCLRFWAGLELGTLQLRRLRFSVWLPRGNSPTTGSEMGDIGTRVKPHPRTSAEARGNNKF